MKVVLRRTGIDDAKELHNMQAESFKVLLDKYQDFETNPANEGLEKMELRLKQDFTYYYFIYFGEHKAGAIRVIDKKEATFPLFRPMRAEQGKMHLNFSCGY